MEIFGNTQGAFGAMFDKSVAIEGVRPNGGSVRGTFAACVMPAELADPFSEDSASTKIYKRVVLIARYGDDAWNLKDPPQIGDRVNIEGHSWRVSSVDPFCDEHFTLEVRSC